MQLYNAANVVLEYDRGLLGSNLVISDKRIILRRLTDKTLYEGFESMKPEIMLYNFSVLDEVAKMLIAEQAL